MTPQEIGQRIKALRGDRQWTLQVLSRRSKVSISALSKIENAQVAASFDTLLRIARGFGLGFDAMLNVAASRRSSGRRPAARFTLTRGGGGLFFSTDMYEYEVHSAELRQKHMIPLHMEVKARRLSDLTRWSSHEGEEFIYVLKGRIELHTEFHAPALLDAGDSAYIDSKMRHAFLNRGKGKAEMLSLCFSREVKLPRPRRPEGPGAAAQMTNRIARKTSK
jgi:transcriptional regulator with XRE-family HTH domain